MRQRKKLATRWEFKWAIFNELAVCVWPKFFEQDITDTFTLDLIDKRCKTANLTVEETQEIIRLSCIDYFIKRRIDEL